MKENSKNIRQLVGNLEKANTNEKLAIAFSETIEEHNKLYVKKQELEIAVKDFELKIEKYKNWILLGVIGAIASCVGNAVALIKIFL